MADEMVVCFSTASTDDEAGKIAKALVEEELAACVNLVPKIRSVYRWQGKIEDGAEVLMLIKTRRTLVDRVTARIKALHSYTVPELISLPIQDGNPDYLAWLVDSTRKG